MRISRTKLLSRKEYVRDAKLCVIASEGTNTEKQYFEGLFGSDKLKVEVLDTGLTGLSAPDHVLARLVDFRERYDLGAEDDCWLMVDVDRIRPQFLSQICQEALQKGFQLAISHPCFELWLYLHFQDVQTPDNRCQVWEQRLRDYLGSYNKSSLNLNLFTQQNITQAIDRAKALDAPSDPRWPMANGTHVYKVAERLLGHIQPSHS